jgi:hypothetical protein
VRIACSENHSTCIIRACNYGTAPVFCKLSPSDILLMSSSFLSSISEFLPSSKDGGNTNPLLTLCFPSRMAPCLEVRKFWRQPLARKRHGETTTLNCQPLPLIINRRVASRYTERTTTRLWSKRHMPCQNEG